MFQVNGGEMVASVANVKRTLAQKWIMYTAGRILQHVYGLLCYTCNNSQLPQRLLCYIDSPLVAFIICKSFFSYVAKMLKVKHGGTKKCETEEVNFSYFISAVRLSYVFYKVIKGEVVIILLMKCCLLCFSRFSYQKIQR